MAASDSTIKEEYTPLKDCKWRDSCTGANTQPSSTDISQMSQTSLERKPFTEKSTNRRLKELNLESDRAGKKRSRGGDEDDDYVE